MKKIVFLFFMLIASIGLQAQDSPSMSCLNYKDGDTYSYTKDGGGVNFTCSKNLTVANTYFETAAGEKIELTKSSIQTMFIIRYDHQCFIETQLKSLMSAGTIKAGESFKVLLTGITLKEDPTTMVGDGTFAVTLVAPRPSPKLLSVSIPSGSALKSYYEPGGSEGIIDFTFSEAVTGSVPLLNYGDPEAGTYGEIVPPITTSGAVVSVDLRGIDLSSNALKGNSAITLALKKTVALSDGTAVESMVPGSVSVFANYTITPASADKIFGGFDILDIDNVDNITCFVTAPIKFDGAKLSYTLGGTATTLTIPASAITVTDEEDGAVTLNVPVKDLSFDAGAVTANILNPKTEGGTVVPVTAGEYTSKGKTVATKCLYITPEPGILASQPFSYTLSFNNPVTVEAAKVITDAEEIDILSNVKVSSNIVKIGAVEQALLGKHQFVLKIKDAQNYITYGDTEGSFIINYDIPVNTFTCKSITPAEGTLTSLSSFALTFNELDPKGDMVGGVDPNKKAVVKNAAGEVVATGTFGEITFETGLVATINLPEAITTEGTYTLEIPEGTIYNGGFDPYSDDLGVAWGARYNPELKFTYTVGAAVPTTVTDINPPVEDTYDPLPGEVKITLSAPAKEVEMANAFTSMMPTDIKSNVSIADNVLTIDLSTIDSQDAEFLRLSLKVSDTNGNYITYGDFEYFITIIFNKPANTFYCIKTNPASETPQTSLKDFTLTFTDLGKPDEESVGGFDTTKEIKLLDKDRNVVTTGTFLAIGNPWDEGYSAFEAKLSLAKEITTPGKYALVLPEGTVYSSLYYEDDADFGVANGAKYNPEQEFSFKVVPADPTTVTISPEGGKVTEYADKVVFTFSRPVTVESAQYLYMAYAEPTAISLDDITIEDKVVTVSTANIVPIDFMTIQLVVKDDRGYYVDNAETEGYDEYVAVTYIKMPAANKFKYKNITPAPGKVTSLKEFVLTYPDMGYYDTSKSMSLVDSEGTTIATGTYTVNTPANFWELPTTATIVLDKEITTDGQYTLIIPEATFYDETCNDSDEDHGVGFGGTYNPEERFNYTIGEVASTTVVVTPEPGEVAALPTTITATFSAPVTITYASLRGASIMEPSIDITSKIAMDGNVATITFDAADIEGRDALNIVLQAKDANDIFVTFGDYEDYINIAYHLPIVANKFECASITPAEGEVSSLETFTLVMNNPDDEGDMVGGFDTSKAVTVTDAAGNVVANGSLASVPGWDAPLNVIVTLDKNITAVGSYTLKIEEGAIYNGLFDDTADDLGVAWGAIYNPALEYKFTITSTSIAEILKGVSGPVEVYNLQGMLIRTADASVVLEGLERGIYIINGVKYAIK